MNRTELIYPELSYKIVGIAFRIFNEASFGFNEKHYQKIFAKELEKDGLSYQKEVLVTLAHKNQSVGRYFLDFVVDNKVVVELKVKPRFGYVHIKQVVDYLRTTGYKLAILIYFTHDGVKYRRIVNLQ